MSVDLSPPDLPQYPIDRTVAEIARSWTIDPRIPGTVRGFDAPFFQAGLAGYSDGAMRLVARRHGAPFCVTEALLDRTLINGGKGRRKEDPDLLATECGMGEIEDNIAAGLDDHPIAGQVMGTFPDEMARASELLGLRRPWLSAIVAGRRHEVFIAAGAAREPAAANVSEGLLFRVTGL